MLTNRISGRMKTIAVILCSFVFTSGYDHKRCDKNGTLFYESLSCKPRFLKPDDECPHYFDCGSLLGRSTNSCVLNGKNYEIGETVEEDIQDSYCKADCTCKRKGNHVEFQCASVDCPEYEDNDDDINSNCYYGYELEHCCSTRKICPPFSNITCKVDNNVFREGEQFYTTDFCSECVCREGFSGEYTERFCKRINCPIELDYAEVIAKQCAPVYLTKTVESTLCCPATFICPTDLEFDLITQMSYSEEYVACTFGNQTVTMGTSFEIPVENIGRNRRAQCKCEVPPFLTCRVYTSI